MTFQPWPGPAPPSPPPPPPPPPPWVTTRKGQGARRPGPAPPCPAPTPRPAPSCVPRRRASGPRCLRCPIRDAVVGDSTSSGWGTLLYVPSIRHQPRCRHQSASSRSAAAEVGSAEESCCECCPAGALKVSWGQQLEQQLTSCLHARCSSPPAFMLAAAHLLPSCSLPGSLPFPEPPPFAVLCQRSS
jgi:hypothetical protein